MTRIDLRLGLEYRNAATKGRDHPGYVAQAVQFDGTNDFLTRGGALTSVVVGGFGTYSEWVRFNGGNGVVQELYINHAGKVQIFKDTTNKIVFLLTGAGGELYQFQTVATYVAGAAWLHIEASWNTHFAAGSKLGQLRINGVSDFAVVSDASISFDIVYTDATNTSIGGYDDGTLKLNADVADLWFSTTEMVDFTVPANEAKFRTALGKPVDLGANGSAPTGTQPAFFFKGPAARPFQSNLGFAGGFTLTGALTDSTPPGPSA